MNNMAQSCKSIYSALLPHLYHHLDLKIPRSWERLAYLEELLNPEANGLKYCRAMSVALPASPEPERQKEGTSTQ